MLDFVREPQKYSPLTQVPSGKTRVNCRILWVLRKLGSWTTWLGATAQGVWDLNACCLGLGLPALQQQPSALRYPLRVLLIHGCFCLLAPLLCLLFEGLLDIYPAMDHCSSVCLQFKPWEAEGASGCLPDPWLPQGAVLNLIWSTERGHMTHSREIKAQEIPQKRPSQGRCPDTSRTHLSR